MNKRKHEEIETYDEEENIMNRRAGILSPVSALAGRYGIGDFGEAAYAFVDVLALMNFHVWQILPLNPIGYGNSPYQPYSSYAGDEIYIALEKLQELGLLKNIERYGKATNCIDYEQVREFKTRYLKEAYKAFLLKEDLQKELMEFEKDAPWLAMYAVFITLKKVNRLTCWLDWPKQHKTWFENRKFDITIYEEEIAYEKFVQFIFYKQWFELKAYANEHGVDILGDIPIYVGIDSADVWTNKACFLLTKEGKPRFIAGVPPDYFSETGQRWGNPIYDWKYLKKTNFAFWIERLRWNDRLYDSIRIDHFRAFDTYWKIPVSCLTAVKGKWVEAPGYELFDEIFAKLPTIQIIAEDLGDLRPEVLELRDYYHLSGMKIVQFALDPNETNNDFEEQKSTIVYTGTHDNQTMKGWYKALSSSQKRRIAKTFPKVADGDVIDRIVHACFDSKADLVILPIQDILKLDDRARINTPGTIGSPNWEWKLQSMRPLYSIITKYKTIITMSGRA